MSELVDRSRIEQIVGIRRDAHQHVARAVSAEGMVYILHSQRCLDAGIDLRQCPYSLALDNGIETSDWTHLMDLPVAVTVWSSVDRSRQVLFPICIWPIDRPATPPDCPDLPPSGSG